MVTAQDFETELGQQLEVATQERKKSVVIKAGDLHRLVGDYPNPQKHRMPVCCDVMRKAMKIGDEIVQQPAKGNGASLHIRYNLSR